MTRFDLISGLMLQSKDGEWVRYEDVEPLLTTLTQYESILDLKEARIHELETRIMWAKQQTRDVTRNLRDTQDALEKTQIALNAAKASLA